MPRFFNTAGPCDPADHYLVPPEPRLPHLRRFIDRKHYFVVHAPRQSGKTTAFRLLARRLTSEGEVAALHATCETAQAAGGDIERGVQAVLRSLERASTALPEDCRPDAVDAFAGLEAESRLAGFLQAWSRRSARPLVLFLDEIDALLDESLLTVLRQLRAGYPDRPTAFPQSVALIGLRDVRDYRARLRPQQESLGTASPFNIKVESITLPDFSAAEVAELYGQHTADGGQRFLSEALTRAYELTQGQPWLVNALAAEAVDRQTQGGEDVTPEAIERAKEQLILRRDAHLDSLVDRLREPRVRHVLEPILAGELIEPDVLDDDIQFVADLGLIRRGNRGLRIANPIYREVIPRALTSVVQESLPVPNLPYVDGNGRLDFERLMEGFRSFWIEHSEFFLKRQPYSEAAAQLIFMAFLQRVVNGGGFVDREYAVGSGRVDLCVRWPRPSGVDRWAIELKVWRDGAADPLLRGLEQLGDYLDLLGLETGWLLIFDLRSQAPPAAERAQNLEVERRGRTLRIVRL